MLRDIAIVVAQDVPYAALERTIRAAGGDWLESVRLFDRYTGAPVPEGAHSLAFALVFRDPTRTLTDEEVNARRAIFAALETQHGAAAGLRGYHRPQEGVCCFAETLSN